MTDLTSYLDAINAELRAAVRSDSPPLQDFYALLEYHLGWRDEQFAPAQVDGGKRLRPVLCLLACELLSGAFEGALPAAAAIELLHNFSLVHDDIEDADETRRHRPTLWTLVGVPHAINAGDALFALAQAELLRLGERGVSSERVLRASQIFQAMCVQLVEGQYLDMRGAETSVETRHSASALAHYKQMVAGKTAALLGAATAMGAAVASDDAARIKRFREFGVELGVAFQMTDDILGLWGDPQVTGKPAGADLRRKKKSLPIVLTLAHGGEAGDALRRAFAQDTIGDAQALDLMRWLDGAEIRADAEQEAEKHRHRASRNLKRILADGVASERAAGLLEELTAQLTHRNQ